MDIEKLLELGIQKNIITTSQREELINLLEVKEPENNPLVVRVIYYIGGFIVLCAMFALMLHTVQHSSYTVILVLGAIYATLFMVLGEFLWKKNEKFPAGILYFLFITSIAFIITDIEKMTGFFPHFSDYDKYPNYYEMCRLAILVLSVLTLFINTVLLKYRKVSILAIPAITCSYNIYFIILYYIFRDGLLEFEPLININLLFFIILLQRAFIKDRLTPVDYSKWMYFVGALGLFPFLITFLCLFVFPNASFELVMLLGFCLSLVYFGIGTIIQRKPFTIIGILGIVGYIMYLEFTYITDNIILLNSTVIITGLLILYAGVLYNKNYMKIVEKIESLLPENLRSYLPCNRVQNNND